MDARVAFAVIAAIAGGALFRRRGLVQSKKELTLMRFGLSAAEISAAANKLQAHCEAVFDEIAAVKPDEATWDNTLGRLLQLEIDTDAVSSIIATPAQLDPSEAVRRASSAAASQLKQMHVSLAMRRDTYLAIKAYADKGEVLTDPEHKRFLERTMRDYRRAGMHLPSDKRKRVEELRRKVKELETTYSQNLAEEKTTLLFTDEELAGLPAGFINSLQVVDGKRKVTLAYPHTIPILRNCRVAATRKKMRIAFDRRGIDANVEILEQVVQLRAEIATIRGYDTHAHFELEVQMAKSPATALSFVHKLADRIRPLAQAELKELVALKVEEGSDEPMQHWDLSYYQRMNVERKHSINDEEVSEYFPLELVTSRMLGIYETLLGVVMKPVENPHVWHEEVTMFSVHDKPSADGTPGRLLGYFYLDLFPRPGKYGHACCMPMQRGAGTNADGTRKRIAVAAMVANFQRPRADAPSLLQHQEVVTFFHEFGHVMHHLLSDTDNVTFASFDCEGDFVEAPSQMLENWCWEAETLQQLSGHYKDTSKPLPVALADALQASKKEHTGLFTLRQLMFGSFDLTIHSKKPGESIDTAAMLSELYPKYLLTTMPGNTNFAAAFGHLCGGYDSKYYSYMWSEVYSSDMFVTRFKKEGLLNPATGMSYRKCILEPGGARDAMDSLIEFLGREPTMDAFLETKGLTNDK